MSLGVGDLWAAGLGVALGAIRGDGVALGTSKRPRRCDAVGEIAADEAGVARANGVDVGATVAAFLGVIFGCGVAVETADATGVSVVAADGATVAEGADVDVAGASLAWVVALVVAATFTNFFGGAFGGGVASDFIFSRAFLAAS